MKTVRYQLEPRLNWIARYKKCLLCHEVVKFEVQSNQQFEEFENDVVKFPCPKCGMPMGGKAGDPAGQFWLRVA